MTVEHWISNAFIATPTTMYLHPGQGIRHSLIYGMNPGYTPRLFRRTRLKRFAPLAKRFELARAVWRWSKGWTAA